jgi:hypothetical protein
MRLRVRRRWPAFAALGVLLGLAITDDAIRAAPPSPARIVAIGDVHGDADALTALLTRAGLIDGAKRWSGGTAVLVQTGDLLDRGTQVREVFDLLMSLEGEASAAGGRVIVLNGNHEGMNATGELRDVAPATFTRFADAQSEERRASAFADWTKLAAKRRTALHDADPDLPIPALYSEPQRDAWMAAHPPGFLEYLEAFGPTGKYGRWVRQHGALVRLDDVVFLHGGIDPEAAPKTLDDVSKEIQKELSRWDAMQRWMIEKEIALPSYTFHDLLEAGRSEL